MSMTARVHGPEPNKERADHPVGARVFDVSRSRGERHRPRLQRFECTVRRKQ